MGGKITNAQLLAIDAQNKLRDIAATESHNIVPSEEELESYLAELSAEEDPFQNRHLNDHSVSSNIAGLFSGERK